MATALGEEKLREQGVEFITLSDEEIAIARERLAELRTEWLAEADSRGFDGEAIIEYARAMVEYYDAAKVVNVPNQ